MRSLLALLVGMIVVCAAPLLGAFAAGQPLARFLAFPPRTAYLPHAPFSWSAFAVFSLPVLAAALVIAWALHRAGASARPAQTKRWPWWSWIGIGCVAAGWVVAWTQDIAPPAWQRQGFTLLWLGYLLLMNALAYRRSGRALLTQRPALLAWLFPASAVFWWLFEYLNQFSANWHYPGAEASGALDYFVQASLPFSTVLPAVTSTWACLRTFPRFAALLLPDWTPPPWPALALGVAGLAALPLRPEWLFPMLWLGPLLVLAGVQQLVARASFDWRSVLQPAIAALVCGLFWELWNYGAVARWEYSVPLVQRFHVFEMPLLGYAGYLPFGVECALVIDLLARLVVRRSTTELL